jgi:hypothetical protein
MSSDGRERSSRPDLGITRFQTPIPIITNHEITKLQNSNPSISPFLKGGMEGLPFLKRLFEFQ